MRIAILTNFKEVCTKEDYFMAKSFAKDGHKVDLIDFPTDIKIEKYYDLIILKNAWSLDEKNYKNYLNAVDELKKRVKKSNCKFVSSQNGNMDFDKYGKKYLAELYKEGHNIVPTIDDIKDLDKLPRADFYIKKPYISYEGFDMVTVKRNQLKNLILKDEILQPKLEFISEVQLYFIKNKFQYALEYTPHKWPDYPQPHEFQPNKKYIQQAKKIIELDNSSCSFYRVDFLRLNEDDMMILEFADSNPNLSLPLLSREVSEKFLKNFKTAVYKFMEEK